MGPPHPLKLVGNLWIMWKTQDSRLWNLWTTSSGSLLASPPFASIGADPKSAQKCSVYLESCRLAVYIYRLSRNTTLHAS